MFFSRKKVLTIWLLIFWQKQGFTHQKELKNQIWKNWQKQQGQK